MLYRLQLVPIHGADKLTSKEVNFVINSNEEHKDDFIENIFKKVLNDVVNDPTSNKDSFHMFKLYDKIVEEVSKQLTKLDHNQEVTFGDYFANFLDVIEKNRQYMVDTLGEELVIKLEGKLQDTQDERGLITTHV